MKKLITFMGTVRYESVTYRFEDEDYKTKFFVEAAANKYRPDEIIVMLTEKARNSENWKELQPILSSEYKVRDVDIREGKSEEELWEIFERITDCLDVNDRVIFDVTHSFRTLPILTLIAATYLRVAKSVQIEAIVYGAYQAKDIDSDEPRPVFELTPFIKLLDWVTATDKFMKTGDAKELAGLLRDEHKSAWKDKDRPKSEKPKNLESFANKLESLSTALQTVRTGEIAEYSSLLGSQLDQAEGEIEQLTKPFLPLLEKIRDEYSKFTEPTLQAQRELICWYAKHGHLVQASILAREWSISLLAHRLSLSQEIMESDVRVRDDLASALNSYVCESYNEGDVNNGSDRAKEFLERLKALEDRDSIRSLWSRIRDLRNDIAHCGFRKDLPIKAKDVKSKVEDIISRLNKIKL